MTVEQEIQAEVRVLLDHRVFFVGEATWAVEDVGWDLHLTKVVQKPTEARVHELSPRGLGIDRLIETDAIHGDIDRMIIRVEIVEAQITDQISERVDVMVVEDVDHALDDLPAAFDPLGEDLCGELALILVEDVVEISQSCVFDDFSFFHVIEVGAHECAKVDASLRFRDVELVVFFMKLVDVGPREDALGREDAHELILPLHARGVDVEIIR